MIDGQDNPDSPGINQMFRHKLDYPREKWDGDGEKGLNGLWPDQVSKEHNHFSQPNFSGHLQMEVII
jgi:hypothetical protein